MQPSNQEYQSDTEDHDDDDDEFLYKARFKREEGSVYFDSKYLVFEPDDEIVTGTKIPWRDLKKCLLNSAGSEKAVLFLFYNDQDKKRETFGLVSRESAESLRNDIKSRLKANKHQSQSRSQRIRRADVENQSPLAIAQQAEEPTPSVKTMQHGPPQLHDTHPALVAGQLLLMQQQRHTRKGCCAPRNKTCIWIWSIIGVLAITIIGLSVWLVSWATKSIA